MKAILVLISSAGVYLLASLGYLWSFTDTVFGGYMGLLLPPAIGLALFVAGFISGACSKPESEGLPYQ